jgi:hypothetical protein
MRKPGWRCTFARDNLCNRIIIPQRRKDAKVKKILMVFVHVNFAPWRLLRKLG